MKDFQRSVSGAAKTALRLLVASLVTVLLAEVLARGILAMRLGSHVRAYGFSKRYVEGKVSKTFSAPGLVATSTYAKFAPHMKCPIYVRDAQGKFLTLEGAATNNSHGFRGREYPARKAPDTLRVVALGASSTWGFVNRDDETYPAHLEKYLNARLAAGEHGAFSKAEVINLAIPHLNSTQIVALFREEGLPLGPDVVTFYEGANDTRSIEPGRKAFWERVGRKSVLVRLAMCLRSEWLDKYRWADVEKYLPAVRTRFLANVRALSQLSANHGFAFYPITQQVTALRSVEKAPMPIRVAYADEARDLETRARERGAGLSLTEFQLVMHADLMRNLRGVPDVRVIDAIPALDPLRDELVSWVHLSSKGNEELAKVIGERILKPLGGNERRPAPADAASPSAPRARG